MAARTSLTCYAQCLSLASILVVSARDILIKQADLCKEMWVSLHVVWGKSWSSAHAGGETQREGVFVFVDADADILNSYLNRQDE